MLKRNFILLASSACLLVSSCVSRKNIQYFQEAGQAGSNEIKNTFEVKIQPNDILSVHVSSLSREASTFFNSVSFTSPLDERGALPAEDGYLVDARGSIEMPLIGTLKVAGLTIPVARDTIKKRLEKYLMNPSVFIRLKNYKITVLGEVTRPSVYNIINERVTLPEALGLAGDLTIFAKRKNVLIIREENGKREYGRVDLTSVNLFDSPYYYLHPNDIVYVEPGRAKIATTDNFYRIAPIIISSLTLISLIATRVTF